jgi:hypothetical protein
VFVFFSLFYTSMNFIRSLKEQGLRRVLVMVLRRSIGMFLEDDIILDVRILT